MSYSHENIERLANMIRNDLQLSVPITASALQSAMQKQLGIIFQANQYHRSTVCEIRHPDLNQYIVVYNPKWSEQQQLWNFAQSLGEIILYYCYKDTDKHVYTGDITIQEIETQTELPPNYLFPTRSHPLEQYLKACQDAKDITDILQIHFLSKHQQLRFLYDTPSETVLYLEIPVDDSPIKQYLLHIPRLCK